MPPDPDLTRLFHIWEAASEAMQHATGRRRDALDEDRLLQHSLIRLLEVVGEAAAGVSDEFQIKHPEIPWFAMIGMRNRLVHGYFAINLDVVWQTIQTDLPPLVTLIRPILVSAGMA